MSPTAMSPATRSEPVPSPRRRRRRAVASAGVLTALTVLQEARMLVRAGRSHAARHLLGAYVRDLSGRVHPTGPPLPSAARNG